MTPSREQVALGVEYVRDTVASRIGNAGDAPLVVVGEPRGITQRVRDGDAVVGRIVSEQVRAPERVHLHEEIIMIVVSRSSHGALWIGDADDVAAIIIFVDRDIAQA